MSAMLFWMNVYYLKNLGAKRKTHTIIYANSPVVCQQISKEIVEKIPHLVVGEIAVELSKDKKKLNVYAVTKQYINGDVKENIIRIGSDDFPERDPYNKEYYSFKSTKTPNTTFDEF